VGFSVNAKNPNIKIKVTARNGKIVKISNQDNISKKQRGATKKKMKDKRNKDLLASFIQSL
jgi:hypothetical protein